MTAASWYASTDEFERLRPERAEAAGAQKEACSVNLDSSRHRLTPGTRVGDHLIVRGVLGEGGTAVVYEALHTRLGASVALKVVDIADEFMEGARARLLREAHVCASLEDPHIPRVYDVGELPDGTPYVVMERVSGRTLENVLAKGPLPLDVAVRITDDLLLAIEAIEKAGIVHRDVKPPNIILQSGSDGALRVRLMDFGVSKNVNAARESAAPSIHANPSLTQHGAIVGTPHYMAPEQIVGPAVDSRADLYAVGVVAYEMMGGRTPFEGQTTGEVVAAVLHTRPLPLSKLCDVQPELEAWVDKAMAPQRADRFSTAREMREALQEAWLRQLDRIDERGRRSWARSARVVGAVSLLALGIALPLPAGYDLHALTKYLRPEKSAEPAANAAGVAPAAAATGAVAPTSAPLPSFEAERAKPADEAAPTPVETALPQAEPLRTPPGEAAAEPAAATAEAAVQPTSDEVAADPKLEADARAKEAAPADPQLAAPAPAAPVRRGREARTRRAPQPSDEAYVPSGGEPVAVPDRGILLDEYLRQLDKKIKGPASDPDDAAEKRVPGQPVPNPFDGVPNNPYDGQ